MGSNATNLVRETCKEKLLKSLREESKISTVSSYFTLFLSIRKSGVKLGFVEGDSEVVSPLFGDISRKV